MIHELTWVDLLDKHPHACRMLYFWLKEKPVNEDEVIEVSNFIELLEKYSILGNECTLLKFFDKNAILVGVYPLGFKLFRCFAESEYRKFFCNDMPDRESCYDLVISNAIELLDERLRISKEKN